MALRARKLDARISPVVKERQDVYMRDSDWPGTLEGVPVQPAIIGVERRGILDISSCTAGERAKFYSFKRTPLAYVHFSCAFG